MKQIFTCLVLFLSIYFLSNAQSVQEQMTRKQVSCKDVLINASEILPKLYAAKAFDSMRVAIGVMQQYCDSAHAIFYAKTLLDIQRSVFSVTALPESGGFDTLFDDYTFTLRTIKAGGYSINKYNYYYYTEAEKKFYSFIQTWAKDLLSSQKMDSSETFICNVLAGNIKHPMVVLKTNKEKYPQLHALLRKNYAAERAGTTSNVALLSGVWIPSGNTKILGTHPSLGFQIGGRSKRSELDLTMQFRFIKSSDNYYVFRSDSLYAVDHFSGGYIGLDYTFYFLHTTDLEIGAIAGAGYDGFDIADPTYNDHSDDHLKPYAINGLNLNAGLRFKYFFNPGSYLGLAIKYNNVSYGNSGGSDLNGNAVSVDIAIGGSL